MDPQVVSVGIARVGDDHGYRVVCHRPTGVRALARLDPAALAAVGVRGVAVELVDAAAPIQPQVQVPSLQLGPGAPNTGLAEQSRQRPLAAGVQIQNWDCDERGGLFAHEQIDVGSAGLIVPAHEAGAAYLISNNHVLAGQNRGQRGDRIAQPGGPTLTREAVIAELERFVPLTPSSAHAHPRFGDVAWNRVDAALARVCPGHSWRSGYLPHHRLPRPGRHARPEIGDEVFKVGRTTGLRRGRVVSIGDRVGPIHYALGPCWFRGSFVVEGLDGQPFSAGGDSGAAVVRSDGAVLGLVYAGNGIQTYACPIREVFAALDLRP